jgi:hypothetical protein
VLKIALKKRQYYRKKLKSGLKIQSNGIHTISGMGEIEEVASRVKTTNISVNEDSKVSKKMF